MAGYLVKTKNLNSYILEFYYSMNRVQYIDVMRGIAILLVVLQHCIGDLKESVSVFVLSFHMPLFFFISGMCHKTACCYEDTYGIVLKRASRLLVPQCFMGLYTILLCVGKSLVFEKGETILDIDFVGLLIGWFLPVLFVVEMVSLIIAPVFKNRSLLSITTVIVGCVFCLCEVKKLVCVEQILGGLLFFLAGGVLRPVLDNFGTIKWGGALFALLIILVAFLSAYNPPIGMYMNQYGSKPLFIITAILGIMAIAQLSTMVKVDNVLNWFGKRSLEVYVLHWGLIMAFRKLIELTIGDANSYPYYLISFLLSCLMIVPLVIIVNKFFPFTFGKFNLIKK